jgi:hypothetical protein
VVTICAWCERYLGTKEDGEAAAISVTHSICAPCVARQDWDESPVQVVSRQRAHLLATLRSLLRGVPEVRVVVDRRQVERRRAPSNVPGWANRRRGADRRKGATLVLN